MQIKHGVDLYIEKRGVGLFLKELVLILQQQIILQVQFAFNEVVGQNQSKKSSTALTVLVHNEQELKGQKKAGNHFQNALQTLKQLTSISIFGICRLSPFSLKHTCRYSHPNSPQINTARHNHRLGRVQTAAINRGESVPEAERFVTSTCDNVLPARTY